MAFPKSNPPILLKPALTIEQQIQLLESRGLSIDNIHEAREALSAINYYHLNYYFHFFLDNNNNFHQGFRLSSIITKYKNDQWLRTHVFLLIEHFEMDLQTRLSYFLVQKYGSDVFYQNNTFYDQNYFKKVQDDFNKALLVKKKNPVICWHKTHYGGRFPLWVIVEFLTITSFCNLYLSMKTNDRDQFANEEYHLTDFYFRSWIFSIAKLRNECAHNGQLFRREITPNPTLHPSFGLPAAENKLLFSRLLILKRLLFGKYWEPFYEKLSQKDLISPFLNNDDYGFPNNWRSLMTM